MKISKKLTMLVLIGIMVVGQCLSAFATTFTISTPKIKKTTSATTGRYSYNVQSPISASDDSYYLKVGNEAYYTVRGQLTVTPQSYHTSPIKTNSAIAYDTYSGTIGDGRSWGRNRSFGYYGSSYSGTFTCFNYAMTFFN